MTNKKQFWYQVEELPEYPPINLEVCHAAAKKALGFGWPAVGPMAFRYHQGTAPIFVIAKDWDRAAKRIVKKIGAYPEEYKAYHRWYMSVGRRLWKTSRNIFRLKLSGINGKKLAEIYQQLQYLVTTIHLGRVPGWVSEQRFEKLTNHIIEELQGHLKKIHSHASALQIFSVLSQPTEQVLTNEEMEGMLRLAAKPKFPPSRALAKHLRKYWFLTYGLIGPGMSIHELRRRVKEARHNGHPLSAIEIRRQQRIELAKSQKKMTGALRIPAHLQKLLNVARLISFEKSWGKEIQFYGHAAQAKIGYEVTRRFGYTLRQFRWMLPDEIKALLLTEIGPTKKELDGRWRDSWLLTNKQGMFFLRGRALSAFLRQQDFERPMVVDKSIQTLQGMPAMSGHGAGRVKIIQLPKEMSKMRRGDILVSHMTIPEIVPAMRQASAIVTDMGGLTCHAAIVARELGIPCVIGTKIATKVLKDGDRVEVDATKGIVRKV